MEFLTKLGPVDLFVVGILVAGLFAGFMQGMIRYALNALVVLVAFVIASQLRVPFFNLIGFWDAFTPDLREQIVFLVLFGGLVIAGFFVVRLFYRRTRLPIIRQLDEIGGAVLGFLFAALSIIFTLIVMDSFFSVASDETLQAAGPFTSFYNTLNSSVLVSYFREALLPAFGLLVRPFVPADIADLLQLK
jgi:uncharacterized membrane protein required for colicin V production